MRQHARCVTPALRTATTYSSNVSTPTEFGLCCRTGSIWISNSQSAMIGRWQIGGNWRGIISERAIGSLLTRCFWWCVGSFGKSKTGQCLNTDLKWQSSSSMISRKKSPFGRQRAFFQSGEEYSSLSLSLSRFTCFLEGAQSLLTWQFNVEIILMKLSYLNLNEIRSANFSADPAKYFMLFLLLLRIRINLWIK